MEDSRGLFLTDPSSRFKYVVMVEGNMSVGVRRNKANMSSSFRALTTDQLFLISFFLSKFLSK